MSTQVPASRHYRRDGGTPLVLTSAGVYSSACCSGRRGEGRREETPRQPPVTETPRANPINLLILLFLASGYVFLPNMESIWAKHRRVSGAGNAIFCCQKGVMG